MIWLINWLREGRENQKVVMVLWEAQINCGMNEREKYKAHFGSSGIKGRIWPDWHNKANTLGQMMTAAGLGGLSSSFFLPITLHLPSAALLPIWPVILDNGDDDFLDFGHGDRNDFVLLFAFFLLAFTFARLLGLPGHATPIKVPVFQNHQSIHQLDSIHEDELSHNRVQRTRTLTCRPMPPAWRPSCRPSRDERWLEGWEAGRGIISSSSCRNSYCHNGFPVWYTMWSGRVAIQLTSNHQHFTGENSSQMLLDVKVSYLVSIDLSTITQRFT